MAMHIVKDSHLPAFVAEGVPVASTVKGNDFVSVGAIRGLAGFDAKQGEDGLYYTNVDTAAEIRIDAVSGAFAVGDPVYRKTADGTFAKAAGEGLVLIGRATRAKAAAAGKLFVRLIPQAA